MASVLESLPLGSRIGIVRLRSLGDCVLTTPALDLLKRFRPDLAIGVVVEDRFRDIYEGNADVEILFPPGVAAFRQWRPAVCLNLHGGSRSAWTTALSGSRWRAGFGHFRFQPVYNVRIPRAQEILGEERTVHTAEHIASAMFYLGVPRSEIPRAKLVTRDARPARARYAVIHPAAAAAEKAWPVGNFVAIAEYVKALGMEPAIIGAASDDLSPFRDCRIVQGAPLSQIKSLLAFASLFIGNDSGPAHMAAAFAVPSVVIFGPSNPAIWGPWRAPAEVVTAGGGIGQVTVAQVLDALTRLGVAA